MRKLFWQINVTLDGFMEGPNRELDFTAQFEDQDFDRYATDMLKSIGGVLLGRRMEELEAGQRKCSRLIAVGSRKYEDTCGSG